MEADATIRNERLEIGLYSARVTDDRVYDTFARRRQHIVRIPTKSTHRIDDSGTRLDSALMIEQRSASLSCTLNATAANEAQQSPHAGKQYEAARFRNVGYFDELKAGCGSVLYEQLDPESAPERRAIGEKARQLVLAEHVIVAGVQESRR